VAKTGEDLINQLYAFFRSQGFSEIGAAYMVGSLIQESRLDPAARQKPGVGFGLSQVSTDKESYKALVDFAKKANRLPDDFVVQAHFIVQQRVEVTKLFKNAKNEDQAKAAVKEFENFGEPGNRFDYGKQIYTNVTSKKPAGKGLGNQVSPRSVKNASFIIRDLQRKFSATGADDAVTHCKAQSRNSTEMSVHASILKK
jgi:hypothetical protein